MQAAVDSGWDEDAQLMCKIPNRSCVLVATEVDGIVAMFGNRRALSNHAPLAIHRYNSLLVTPKESGL